MPVKVELPPPWAQFLAEVDQSLSSPVELHCLGGFVFVVLYGIPQRTNDLDHISVIPNSLSLELENIAGAESQLAKKHKVRLQHASGVSDIPEDYEERLVTLELGLSKMILKVLDPYDLVLSKLTRNWPIDREDIKALAAKLHLSFGTLTARFDKEMRRWVENLARHELTLNLWSEYFGYDGALEQKAEHPEA